MEKKNFSFFAENLSGSWHYECQHLKGSSKCQNQC